MAEVKSLRKVTIHTDGACDGNPGPGGWAAVLRFGEHVRELTGGESLFNGILPIYRAYIHGVFPTLTAQAFEAKLLPDLLASAPGEFILIDPYPHPATG